MLIIPWAATFICAIVVMVTGVASPVDPYIAALLVISAIGLKECSK